MTTTRELDPFADRAAPAEIGDDPFARAAETAKPCASSAVERTVSLSGPLAQRDPLAPPDRTAEIEITGATSFEDVLRRARRRGFAAGVAAGALAVLAGAAALSWWTSPPGGPAEAEASAAPSQAEEAPAAPPARKIERGAPASAPAPAREGAQRTGTRRAPPAPPAAETRDHLGPGLDLRPPEATESPPEDAHPVAEAAAERGLDDGEVAAAFEARRPAIEGCIGAHPDDVAGAAGRRVRLVVLIEPAGHATRARIDDAEVGATALGACLVRAVQELAVPAFDGDAVRIELPLRFAREE